jgi:DNA-binding LacI/PurR family transcriptional regulator
MARGSANVRCLIEGADRPSAMVLVNEAIVIGFYRGPEEAGLKPGRDMPVIGQYSPFATMPAFTQHYPDAAKRQLSPIRLIEGESESDGAILPA